MKKLPYGISDFKRLKENDFYYIDKTNYIEKLEVMPEFLFFIRPRRFGKSLFLSMLECYYDYRYKDNFETIFKDTYILKNPTKEANSYYILRFDFSAIDSDKARESFNDYCNSVLKVDFCKKNNIEIEFKENFISNLNELFLALKYQNKKLYLFIDEYDNFINKILMSDQSEYESFITDRESIYKQFFTVLKSATSGADAPLKKMFITGVSPMALFDVTSGYNIGTNITTNPIFNDMIGVTKTELKEMIKFYNLSIDVKTLDKWYNNYSFSEEVEHTIYNTDMILYHMNHILINGSKPKELIDINVRSDYSKLRYLIYTDKKLNGNFSTLKELLANNRVSTSQIVSNFSAISLRKIENFKSLLYYLGLVTIDSSDLEINLKIPNETIKRVVCEYIKESLELEDIFKINLDKFSSLLAQFAKSGALEVFEYLAEVLKESSKVRDYIDGEAFLKGFLLAYFSLTNYYIATSEAELNKGFADIFLEPLHPKVTYIGLIEIKYIPRSKFDKATLESKIKEAKEQLIQYEQDREIIKLNDNKKIKSVVLVFSGWEIIYIK